MHGHPAVAFACAWSDRPQPAHPREIEGEESEAGHYPNDWFGLQRAFPGTTIPQDRWRAAVEQTLLERSLMRMTTDAGPGLVWTQVGPSNIGGRVTAIASPPGGGIVYLGSADGGVFKSTNDGVDFAPVFDAVGVPSIGAIAVSPVDANTVYVGTGESNGAVDNYDGAASSSKQSMEVYRRTLDFLAEVTVGTGAAVRPPHRRNSRRGPPGRPPNARPAPCSPRPPRTYPGRTRTRRPRPRSTDRRRVGPPSSITRIVPDLQGGAPWQLQE